MYINILILLAWLYDFILGSMRNVKNVMKCICAAYLESRKKHFEPPHDKTNKMTFLPAKTQISLGIRQVRSETSLCAPWVA